MNKFGLIVLVIAVAAGCKKSPEPLRGEYGEQPPQQGEWQPVPPTTEEQPVEEAPGLQGLPEAQAPTGFQEALAALRSSTERVRTSTEQTHDDVIVALRSLADAVAGLPDVENRDTYRTNMLTYADKIQTSDITSMEHADWVKSALKETADALGKVGKTRNIEGFDARVDALNQQIGVLETNRALLEQRESVATALDQLAAMLTDLSPEQTGTR